MMNNLVKMHHVKSPVLHESEVLIDEDSEIYDFSSPTFNSLEAEDEALNESKSRLNETFMVHTQDMF